MLKHTLTIQNKLGLHARASAKLVAQASRFPCHIGIQRDGVEVNGKSIMGIMMLAAAQGTAITLIADGEQEEQAIQSLTSLMANSRSTV
ncbi:MAG: HPr family phosphocarrier protein, partial [Mariprofundaceae bacterium]|nr:HPr family phosphocarrier protein [Mariprofundaceae bacterium]